MVVLLDGWLILQPLIPSIFSMSDPFLGQIQMFPFNFAPRAWSDCNGQLLPISQNSVLFSLLGTIYGGDGRTTFALPDLRSRVPIHTGTGPGLSSRNLGSRSGAETHTLLVAEMPSHSHGTSVTADVGNQTSPVGTLPATANDGESNYSNSQSTTTGRATTNTGGTQAHNNMPPFLTIRFCIALQGIYPSRS